ncbi:MAG: hypothetical protein BWK76_22805 [Desulfobulbaceae bacterium A2]|nr:MAG: hypothetical protein BWK76_22805 [Desulfobulbaceae bacterium A2]
MNRDLEILRPWLTAQVLATIPQAEQVHFLVLEDVAEGAEQDGDWQPPAELAEALRQLRHSGCPASWAGWLLLPWSSQPPVAVALVVQGEALPSLPLERVEFLATHLSHQLSLVCQAAVDPVSGLYNLRALQPVLARLQAAGRSFLLACIGVSLSEAGPWDAQGAWARTVQLLGASSALPVFFLGGSLFALVREGGSPRDASAWARRCLHRLRRAGIARAHIGMQLVAADGRQSPGVTELLQRCRAAYAEARRHGALGQHLVCDAGHNVVCPPAPPELTAALHRAGRLCALALLASDGDHPLPSLTDAVQTLVSQHTAPAQNQQAPSIFFHPLDAGRGFLLLPGLDAVAALAVIRGLQTQIAPQQEQKTFSCGIAVFPGGGEGRAKLPEQCHKALRHAGFFGPAAVTVYDAVSCNICGDWYYDQGDLWSAVREYRLGLRLAPEDVNLLNSLGVAWAELFEHRRAAACFRQVLARELDNFMAWINLGQSLVELGDEERALACFESALDSGGKEAAGMDARTRGDLLLQLGRIYGRRQRHREALALLDRCLTECPEQEAQLLPLMAQAHAGLAQQKQAVRCAQRALQLRPDDPAMLSLLGLLYLQGGQGEDIALSLCRQAVTLAEGDIECWLSLVQVLLHLGREDETRAALRRCQQLAPRHPRLLAVKKECRAGAAAVRGKKRSGPLSATPGNSARADGRRRASTKNHARGTIRR